MKKLTKTQKAELDEFDLKFGIRHYDKLGMPMRMSDFVEKFEDWEYRHICTFTNAFCRVSTVWLGIDHGYNNETPIIFETMVFICGESIDCDRYTTEAEARRGHDALVKKYKWRIGLFLYYLVRSVIRVFVR